MYNFSHFTHCICVFIHNPYSSKLTFFFVYIPVYDVLTFKDFYSPSM